MRLFFIELLNRSGGFCLDFVSELDEEGIIELSYKVVELIKEWILLNEERNRAVSISLYILRAKVSSCKIYQFYLLLL